MRKWIQRSLFVLALATALAVAAMVTRQRQLTLDEMLAGIEQELAGEGAQDDAAVLRRLDIVVGRARSGGARDIEARALMLRGRVLLSIGAPEDAVRDFRAVLSELRPGDHDVRRMVIEAEMRAGRRDEALRELEALLADEPEFGPAWVQAGRLHVAGAEAALDRARAEIDLLLVGDERRTAYTLLARLAARDPSDIQRVATGKELGALLPRERGEILARVLILADQASVDMRAARRAWGRALELGEFPEALAGLMRGFVDADRLAPALALGQVASTRESYAADVPTQVARFRALARHGDLPGAASCAAALLRTGAPLEPAFLIECCETLRRAEAWPALRSAATRLGQIGAGDLPTIAGLYNGLALADANNVETARPLLRAFTLSEIADPFPRARYVAWSELARLARTEGLDFAEREALHAALEIDPDGDGAQWFRLAELQAEGQHGGLELAVESMAQAIRLLPQRADAIMPRWRQLGDRWLRAQGRDLETVYRDLRRRRVVAPLRDAGHYELFRIAEKHLEQERWQPALIVCRRLLVDLPDFLPAIELSIEAELALGRTEAAASLVRRRIELAGWDERAAAWLARLPEDALPADAGFLLARAAPQTYGRIAIARHQRRVGRVDLALDTLLGAADQQDVELARLTGTLLFEEGRYAEALTFLARVPPDDPRARAVRPRMLIALLREDRNEGIVPLLKRAIRAGTPDEWTALADALLAFGEPDPAVSLLRVLDAEPRTRSAGVLCRLAAAHQLAGRPDDARDALLRGEFFDPDGTLVIGAHLISDAFTDDWQAVEDRSRASLADGRTADPLELTVLHLFAGDAVGAAAVLDDARSAGMNPVQAALLRAVAAAAAGRPPFLPAGFGRAARAEIEPLLLGREGARRDPRRVAALVLALSRPEYLPLGLAELRAIREAGLARVLPAFLEARTMARLGDLAAVRDTLLALGDAGLDFEPGWALLLEQERARSASDSPRLAEFIDRRRRALAASSAESLPAELARSEVAQADGNLEAAIQHARRALALGGNRDARARIRLAEALTAAGRSVAALDAWRQALAFAEPHEVRQIVPGLLALLSSARDASPPQLTPGQTHAALAELAERAPDAPWVVLAQAEEDLEIDPDDPTLGVRRALGRLELFRERFQARALEDLRLGTTARWAAFLRRLDPGRAETFLERELALVPGDVELWLALARTKRDRHDPTAALELMDIVARASEDPRIPLERAAALLASGAPHSEVMRAIAAAGPPEDHPPEVAFERERLQAQSALRVGGEALETALASLEQRWDARASLDRERRLSLALLFARGRLVRGGEGDAAAARALLTGAKRWVRDAYTATLVEALSGLAGQAAARPLAALSPAGQPLTR